MRPASAGWRAACPCTRRDRALASFSGRLDVRTPNTQLVPSQYRHNIDAQIVMCRESRESTLQTCGGFIVEPHEQTDLARFQLTPLSEFTPRLIRRADTAGQHLERFLRYTTSASTNTNPEHKPRTQTPNTNPERKHEAKAEARSAKAKAEREDKQESNAIPT